MEIILSCGSEINDRNSQYGENLSPGIEFKNVPEEAESLVVFMEDLNASETRRIHWVIWNIPPGTDLPEGIPVGEEPGVLGVSQGNNDFDVVGYTGPEYPPGNETYRFTVYALDSEVSPGQGATSQDVRLAMQNHVVDKATVEAGYTD